MLSRVSCEHPKICLRVYNITIMNTKGMLRAFNKFVVNGLKHTLVIP